MKNNLTTKNNDAKEYEKRTYDDLSSELKTSVARAFELIGLMYNRLTLVENLSHKEAIAKIYDDHKDLPGFSQRNIRRYLPLDNPSVPRRVRTLCPKDSDIKSDEHSKLSSIKQKQETVLDAEILNHCKEEIQEQTENNANSSLISNKREVDDNNNIGAGYFAIKKAEGSNNEPNQALEECCGCQDLYRENCELKEALKKSTQLTIADKPISSSPVTAYAPTNCIDKKDAQSNIFEFEFHLRKQQIIDYLGKPYLWMKDPDLKVWFSGQIDIKNRSVISPKPGRIGEQLTDTNLDGDDMQNG